MTNLNEGSRKGYSEILTKGISRKLAAVFSAAIIVILSVLPQAAQAASSGITQFEYLQWLVQLSGDAGQFSENSVPNDYVNWARAKGVDPSGGWKLGAKLSKQALAQTLAQLLNLNPPGKSQNYIQALARNGITLPDDDEISRPQFATLVGDGLESHLTPFASISPSKGNNGPGSTTPAPGWLNPRNPHFGDLPHDGSGPGNGNGNPHGPANGPKNP